MKAQGKNAQKTFNKNFILTFAAITSLLYVSILATFHQTSIVYAENENVKVYGFIFEFGTNKPLQGAKINLAQTLLAETNASGYFEGYVKVFKVCPIFTIWLKTVFPEFRCYVLSRFKEARVAGKSRFT